MQEALIRTYRHVSSLRDPAAFRPWLYRTVRNACLKGRRKRVGEPSRLQSLDQVLPGPEGSWVFVGAGNGETAVSVLIDGRRKGEVSGRVLAQP